MDIITIPNANMNLAETQDEYLTLPVRAENITVSIQDDEDVVDVPSLVSAWRPSGEELELLNSGGYVQLRILGVTHPPVMLTVEEDFEK